MLAKETKCDTHSCLVGSVRVVNLRMVWQIQIEDGISNPREIDALKWRNWLRSSQTGSIRPKANSEQSELSSWKSLRQPKALEKPALMPSVLYRCDTGRRSDALRFLDIWVVSSRLRAIIEKFDPDNHDFYPVEICDLNEENPRSEIFYALHVRVHLESVDTLKSDIRRYNFGGWEAKEPWSVFFRKSVIEGHHIWKESHYMSSGYGSGYFASDDFVSHLESRKIRGIFVSNFSEVI